MKQTKRIIKFLEEIDWLFNLNNFDRKITLKKEDDENKCGEIIYDEIYQTNTINLYPCFFKQKLEEQRKILLHELIHSITLPSKIAMTELLNGYLITPQRINSINEIETSKIENIIDGLLQNRLSYSKKAYKNYLNT